MGIQQMLLGAGGGVVSPLPTLSSNDTQLSPTDPFALITFGANGQIISTNDGTFNWFAPAVAGVGATYWVRATVNSGTSPSGQPVGSWLQLDVDRTWILSRSTVGITTCSLTFQIATDSGGANIIASGIGSITTIEEI